MGPCSYISLDARKNLRGRRCRPVFVQECEVQRPATRSGVQVAAPAPLAATCAGASKPMETPSLAD